MKLIDRIRPTWIFLDYDLQPCVDASPVAAHMVATQFSGEIVITSQNPFGQAALGRLLPRATVAPFGNFEIVRGEK